MSKNVFFFKNLVLVLEMVVLECFWQTKGLGPLGVNNKRIGVEVLY